MARDRVIRRQPLRLAPRQGVFLLVYLLLVLAFTEGCARWFVSDERRVLNLLVNDDAWWRLWWSQRHQRSGPIMFKFDVYHPQRGWALASNLHDPHAMGQAKDKLLSTNSEGLRGSQEYAPFPAPGKRRILVLGDSFTFGEDVADDETYCAQLARLMPEAEVLNLGVHGYGYDQMLLYLKEVAGRYHPDVVVVGFLYDDMDRVVLSFRDFAKPRYLLKDGKLILTHTPVPPPEKLQASRSFALADLLDILGVHLSPPSDQAAQEVTGAILAALARQARDMGAQPVFAYLPVREELVDPQPSLTGRELVLQRMGSREAVPSLFLRPWFIKARAGGVTLTTHGHYGPTEHAVAAEGLCSELRALP